MAIGVSEKDLNMIDRPVKKEKLFRRKPMAMDMNMVRFVDKEPLNQQDSSLEKKQVKKKSLAMIEFAEQKQVECGETKACNGIKRKREVADIDSAAMDRAREIQARLGPEYPSFVKYMLPSHVVASFCLSVPSEFCRLQLGNEDLRIILEDDGGKEYETKYLLRKGMLSGGWRAYAIAHRLVPGDVLVFHLVQPSKFKIYTVRADGSDELDGALALLELDASMEQKQLNSNADADADADADAEVDVKEEYALGHLLQAINESEDEVESTSSFNIMVNGVNINSNFPKHVRTKYHDLCRSQQSNLHQNLLDDIFLDVAEGAITEITNIADGIRASNAKTPRKEFTIWDTTLRAFEIFGMNVSFLRARIAQLMSLIDESERKSERVRVREDLRNLVMQLKERIVKLDVEIESMEVDPEKLESVFHDVANEAWVSVSHSQQPL